MNPGNIKGICQRLIIKYMNLTIILTSLAALLIGLVGGATYTEQLSAPASNETVMTTTEESVTAEDYLSIRPALATLPLETLTTEEKDDLLYMREEEKLARDVYQTLYEKWNLSIFSNIAQSEQTHTEAVRDLLEKYNITDPVINDTVGVFQNEELQTLYNTLTEKGLTSEIDALVVGATIEDLDIKDLIDSMEQTNNQDITLVYENLMRGSRNHLRAFNKQLSVRGVTYEPQYISNEEYQTIISGSTERGGTRSSQNDDRNDQGRGWGGR
jgi:hypothetical protein